MTAENSGERHSVALSDELITDPEELARKEAENGLLQFDLVDRMVEEGCDPERQPFRFRPRHILQLHRQALEGISHFAGTYRPGPIEIGKSNHIPPDAFLVSEYVQELCDYVGEKWNEGTALHLMAYVLWRMNWIHPFTDGNGRTARAASYLVLCVRLGMRLPGSNTIPEQIAENKKPYYEALEAADAVAKQGRIDVSQMENYLEGLLANQLLSLMQEATGQPIHALQSP